MIRQIYRTLIPRTIQSRIDIRRQDEFLRKLRNNILKYLSENDNREDEDQVLEVLSFLKKNPLHMFPYNFIHKYDANDIEVHNDQSSGYNYVYYMNKKLFYPLGWSTENIKYSHTFSCLEQDKESPHSYAASSFNYKSDDIVVDAGAAEGNFSLSVVEKVKKLYIFECSEGWLGPLRKTFEPWSHKVQIIPLRLSDICDSESTTIDHFFRNKKSPSLLKIDVDGGEKKLLDGATEILEGSEDIKVALCTYHKQNDYKEFHDFLQKLNFRVRTSNGYMIFYLDEPLEKPYLRKALIFASKD